MMKMKTLYVLFNFILFINQAAPFKIPTTSNCNLTLLEEEDDHQITDTSSEFLIYILDISNSRDQKFKTENSDLFLPQRWYSVKNIDLMQQLQLLYSVYTSIFQSVYQSKFRELSVNATPSGCFYNLNDDELENVARTFFWKEVRDGNDYICSAHVSQENGVGYLFFRCCHQTDFQNYDCVDIEQKNYLWLMYIPSLIIAILTFIFFAYIMLKYPIIKSEDECRCIKDNYTFDFYPENLKLEWTEDKMKPNIDHKWVIENATDKWKRFINIKNGESVTVKAIKLRVKRKNTIEKGRKLMDLSEYIKYWVNSNCCESCISSCCRSCKCGVCCYIVLYLMWLLFSIVSLVPLFVTLHNKKETPCEVYMQKNLTCSDNIYERRRVVIFLIVYIFSFILLFFFTCVLKCCENCKNTFSSFSYFVTLLSTIPCCTFVYFAIYFMIRFVFTCLMSGDPTSNVILFSLPIVYIIIVIFSKTDTDTFVEDIMNFHKEAKFIYSRKCINANEAVTFTLGQDKRFIGQLYFHSNKLVFKVNQPLIFLRKDGKFNLSKKFACAPFPYFDKKSAREYNWILTKIILLMVSILLLVVAFTKLNTFYSRSSTFVSWVGYAALAIQKLGMNFFKSYNQQEQDNNYQLLEDYKNIYGTYSETWIVTKLITESNSSAGNSNQSTNENNTDGGNPDTIPKRSSQSSTVAGTSSNQSNTDGGNPDANPNSCSQSSTVAGTSSNQSNTDEIKPESNPSSSSQISTVAGTSPNQTNDDIHSRKQTVHIDMASSYVEYLTKHEKPKENISSSDIMARAADPKHKYYEAIEKETDHKKIAIKKNRTNDEEKQPLLETEEKSLNV